MAIQAPVCWGRRHAAERSTLQTGSVTCSSACNPSAWHWQRDGPELVAQVLATVLLRAARTQQAHHSLGRRVKLRLAPENRGASDQPTIVTLHKMTGQARSEAPNQDR